MGYRVSPDQPGLQGRTLSQKKTKIQTKRNTCEGPICVSKFSIFTNNVAIFPFSLLENIATMFFFKSFLRFFYYGACNVSFIVLDPPDIITLPLI